MGYEDFAKLHKDASGHFDVILSPTRPAGYGGDWWQLDPKASFLMIRQVSADWTTERDPTISIERTDISVERPQPSAIDLEQRLRDVPRRAFNIASFIVEDWKSVASGKSVLGSVDIGGRRNIKKKKET